MVVSLSDPTVGTTLSLIHTYPGRAWTLDTLARATGTPRATLTRRFAALTGQSPMAYLTAWRMSLAARRLRDGDATVRQIADEVGYDSEFAFARAFSAPPVRRLVSTASSPKPPADSPPRPGRSRPGYVTQFWHPTGRTRAAAR